jgi:hypothetical protein
MKFLSFLFFACLLPFAFGAAFMWVLADTDLLTFLMDDPDSFAAIILCWGVALTIVLLGIFSWYENCRPVKRDTVQYLPLRLVDLNIKKSLNG